MAEPTIVSDCCRANLTVESKGGFWYKCSKCDRQCGWTIKNKRRSK